MPSIDLNKVQVVLFHKHKEEFNPGVTQEFRAYHITLDNKRIGRIETLSTSFGVNYVSQFKIDSRLRGKGIGTYVLKKFFKGYFISAGNPKVQSLYNRIGKGQDKFSGKENKMLAKSMGMWGTWRIK